MITQRKFLKLNATRPSPTKDFFLFSVTVVFVTSLIAISLSSMIYHSHVKSVQRDMALKAANIEKTLSEIFDDTNRLLVYIGKQIARYDKENDLNFIASLLASVSEAEFKAKTSITFIEWLNKDNMQVVNGQTGVIPDPVDMSFREHTKLCPKDPWSLQMSIPDMGIPSGLWVIPAGTGVVSEKNQKFLGTVVVGFSVTGLSSKLTQTAFVDKASFLILDKQCNIVLQSEDLSIDIKSPFYKDSLSNLQLFHNQEGLLPNEISYQDIQYYAYKKMSRYPYIIMVGYDKGLFWRDFYALVLPRIIEIVGMAVCLALIIFYRRKMFSFSDASAREKEAYLRKFSEDFRFLLERISYQAATLLEAERNPDSYRLSKQKRTELLENVSQGIDNLYNLSTDNLKLGQVDINKLLNECVLIHSQTAFLQSKKIISNLQSKIPLFCADETRFKQIILGLISLSLKCTQKGSFYYSFQCFLYKG